VIGRSRPLARSLLMFFRAYRAYRAGISPLSNFCDHGLCSGARSPEIRPNIATALPVRFSVGLTECAHATSATARPLPDWPQHDIAGKMAFFFGRDADRCAAPQRGGPSQRLAACRRSCSSE
jgi:hypothetical protein